MKTNLNKLLSLSLSEKQIWMNHESFLRFCPSLPLQPNLNTFLLALDRLKDIQFFKYTAAAAAAAAKSLQSFLTLCDPRDGSPSGSPVPGILQARTLEWIAISFSNAWKWKVKVKSLCHARLLATPWTAAYQAPPSVGFSRQEYWSGLHCLLR